MTMAEYRPKNNTPDRPSQKGGRPDLDKVRSLAYSAIFDEQYRSGRETAIYVQYKRFLSFVSNALRIAQSKTNSGALFTVYQGKCDYQLSTHYEVSILNKRINGEIRPYDPTAYEVAKNYGCNVESIEIISVFVNGKEVPFKTIYGKALIDCGVNDEVIVNGDATLKIERERYESSRVLYRGMAYDVVNQRVSIPNYTGGEVCDFANDEIRYTLTRIGGPGKGKTVIKIQDDPTSEVSLYDVFFDGDADTVYFDGHKLDTFDIVSRERETGRITIKTDGKDISGFKKVYLSTDLTQLTRERNAIRTLMDRPSIWHKPLLSLALDRRFNNIPKFEPNSLPLRYKILTDASRSGTQTQRKFVQNAMQTPDFMILQGPPGSGKTTAILELIYQLCKEGKRVLLCASTHVAIDNVLEKILQHQQRDELLSVINPVRVGDANRLCSDMVKPFIYDNLKEGIDPDYDEIFNKSFNLVCGTVIGILKYPEIYQALDNTKSDSLDPMFDVMILDEASKTTFAEFLVPAVLCKRWIIVGDIKQLAPYVEQENLAPTLLDNDLLSNQSNRIGLQLLYSLSQKKKWNKYANRAYVLPRSAIEYIDKRSQALEGMPILAVTGGEIGLLPCITPDEFYKNSERLVALSADGAVLLIEEGLETKVLPYLPPKMCLMHYKVDLRKDPSFISIKFKGGFDDNYEDELEECHKRVEDEIIWRLIRLYELKENQKSALYCKAVIDGYMALLDDNEKKTFKESLHLLQDIAIPSIIMMLQEGVDREASEHVTVLSHGFSSQTMENRFIMLDYQHRMHPDLSRVPRKYVYDDKALKDSPSWESHLQYPSQNPRRLELRLINASYSGQQNRNDSEVKSIVEELEKFLSYCEHNPREDGKPYELAILTYYNAQLIAIRSKVQSLFNATNLYNFSAPNLHVTINTVDKFQGQEADVVYLSVVRRKGKGFLDSINRINVSITRAKEKLIIFGNEQFFQSLDNNELLSQVYTEAK